MKRVTRGEIVQVEGGHILRSTGRKDRHSKVYTAKGPRDRRVRLSAHTAIQFYDVQDRLGYDRPSKAVDWLIKKAKNSIDKLAELPPWNPNDDVTNIISTVDQPAHDADSNAMVLESIQMQLPENPSTDSSYMIQMRAEESQSITNNASKPFFLMNSGTSLMNFQSYPHEDLGLSLQTIHDQSSYNHRAFSSTTNPVSFEAAYPRMASWVLPHQQQLFSNGSAFLQREPLQSNFSNLIHSWEDRPIANNSSITNTHFNGNFQFPAGIRDEDEHGGVSIKTSSASPNSHH